MRLNTTGILIFLVLCALTIGCVSAADDMDSHNNLTADDISEDLNLNDNEILTNENDYKDVEIDVAEIVNVDEHYSSISTIFDDNYINGTIYGSIDGQVVFTESYSTEDEEYFCLFSIGDLKSVPSYGMHKVNITYQKYNSDTSLTIIKDVEFNYSFYINSNRINDCELGVQYTRDIDMEFNLPENSNGVLTFTVNGKTYTVNIKDGLGNYMLKSNNFKIGTYTINFKYVDNEEKYPERFENVTLTIHPKITWQNDISTNEKDSILVYTPKGTNIKLIVYKNNDGKWGKKIANFTSKGGLFFIPVDKILTSNFGNFYINYTVGTFSGYYEFDIGRYANSKNIASKIVKKGDSVKVVLTGPKVDDFVEIYLDNDHVKDISLKKGRISKTLSNLEIGKHKITLKVYGSKFYSNTFYVTIKAKDKVSLSLKTVKVKKHAKKLVLKATLKINKKTKKGLKVTFKFNGKSYKAKTNSKGIAKVTIKKKVLKKLKVGKKVKYQVKYSFKTVTKKAKVKK